MKALIVRGGWEGHYPQEVSEIFAEILDKENFTVEISDTLESFADEDTLRKLDLIIPIWTMGTLKRELTIPVIKAVAAGVGMAGCHGGMCDAFRDNMEWQFLTGGNFVSHPGGGGVEYEVNIKRASSALVEGIDDFKVKSEQYYFHVDPAIEVLATTFPAAKWYHSANGIVEIPVVWTRRWGHGRVFYNALGHDAGIFDIPQAKELMRRGFLWAAEGKSIAMEQGLDPSEFESSG